MSDYKDIIKNAIEKGFVLDICGTDERHYSWGLYTDLCGMTVEDAKEAENGPDEGGSGMKKNIITFTMQNKGDGTYVLVLSATYEPTANVSVSFSIDGVQQNLTIPAGQKTLVTDISGVDPNYPYAEITSITITSTDESYEYSSKNNVKNGIFTLTIYYGSVLQSNVPTFNDFDSLDILEYTFGEPASINFVVPASPEYNWASSELDDNEFEEWMAEHMHDFYVMVPNNGSVSGVTFKNSLGIDITETFSTLPNSVTYNGTRYTVYHRQNQTQLGYDTPPSTLAIEMQP